MMDDRFTITRGPMSLGGLSASSKGIDFPEHFHYECVNCGTRLSYPATTYCFNHVYSECPTCGDVISDYSDSNTRPVGFYWFLVDDKSKMNIDKHHYDTCPLKPMDR